MRKLFVIFAFLALSFNAAGEETISFVWQVHQTTLYKSFKITAIKDSLFTVDWGDGFVDTITGSGSCSEITHFYKASSTYKVNILNNAGSIFLYFDCFNRQLSVLNLMECSELKELNCYNNELVGLDIRSCSALEKLDCSNNLLNVLNISKNTALNTLSCYNNHLQLYDLYTASEQISNSSGKWLGRQTLTQRSISEGASVNFSAQREFGGISTVFAIEKDKMPAMIDDDYTIDTGMITFHKMGIYKIIMTNEAIVSRPDCPAQVVAEYNVGGVHIEQIQMANDKLRIYPNPTSGQFTIEYGSSACFGYAQQPTLTAQERPLSEVEVEIYNVVRQMVYTSPNPSKRGESSLSFGEGRGEVKINVSHLANGMYFLKIDNKVIKFVKN